jgi:Flp pilus assembly protein TadG
VNTTRRGRGAQRGQSTVELAISSIVLLLLLTGLLDLSRVFYYSVIIHNAAREGARHGAWYDVTARQNPYLDQADIQSAVNDVLTEAGLPSASLRSGCPTPSDGNSVYNPPYQSSAYPTSTNQPYLFICYDNGSSSLPASTPPSVPDTYWQHDLNVTVIMAYGLVTGFMQNVVGNNIRVASNAHMTVQGHP